MDAAIEARGLAKRFGDVTAVAGVDFDVRAGELFGFLGPNGAGKTTTINMLTGLVRPDGGTVRVGGIDCTGRPKAAQHLIGVVPDESNLYPELTGLENLCFCGALYGLARRARRAAARDWLDRLGLADAADRKFGAYSKGMKRKATLAAGMIHAPPILFLDEPTSGLDVASARQMRQTIADLGRGGTTIFLTTHYIEEAERLCGRVAFLVAGRIVRTDGVEHLLEEAAGRHVLEFALDGPAAGLEARLREALPGLEPQAVGDRRIRVTSDRPLAIGPLVRFFEGQGLGVGEARKVRPSLEEVFVEVTGIEAAVMQREKDKAGAGP